LGREEALIMRNFILYNIVGTIKSTRLRYAVKRIEDRSAFKYLTGKATRNRPLGRPRRKREDKIRIVFKEIGVNARKYE
jgi:hypothetical protein